MRRFAFLLALLFLWTPLMTRNAAAETIFTYTSTSDFDGGDKNDPGTSYAADNGVDQPTYGFISVPAAMYHAATQRTYIVWQGASSFSPYITYYDHVTGLWTTEVQVAVAPAGQDGHGAPSMTIDNDGYIYVFYGSHSNAQKAARSALPNGISSWVAMTDPEAVSTYPNLIYYNENIYYFYRNADGFGGHWAWRKSSDKGATWSAEVSVIIPAGLNGQYIGGWAREGTRLYWGWTRFIAGTGLRNVYSCYFDMADELMYSVAGVSLGASVDTTEAEDSCKAYSSVDGTGIPRFRVLNGNLYGIFNEGTDVGDNHNLAVKFIRWTTAGWTVPTNIINQVDNGVNHADFIVNSATNIEALITTSGLNHGCQNDCEYSGDIERWTWDGTTWTLASTLMTETESGEPVNHPYAVLNGHTNLRFIFHEFGSTSTKTRLKIYGWGANGFVYNSAVASGTGGVESTTDSSDVTSGAVRLASRQRDEFTNTKTRPDTFKWQFREYGDGTASCTTSMANGVLSFTWDETGAGTGRKACQISSRSAMSGNFDIRMKFQDTDSADNGVGLYGLCAFDNPDQCGMNGAPFTTTDGVSIDCFSGVNGALKTWKLVSGVRTQVGAENAVCSTSGFWLRITRAAGGVFTTYYSTNGSDWTQDEQVTIAGAGTNAWPHAYLETNAVTIGTYTVALDQFLEANSVMTTPFRTTGSWSTPSISAVGGQKPVQIVLTYSGLSATEYIDSVSVLSGAGTTVYSDATDITSGTSKTITVTTSSAPATFTAKVAFVGSGSASPVLESVQVTLREITNGGGDLPDTGLLSSWDGVEKLLIYGGAFAFSMIGLSTFSSRRRKGGSRRRR